MGYAIIRGENGIGYRELMPGEDVTSPEVYSESIPSNIIWDDALKNVREATLEEILDKSRQEKINQLKIDCNIAIQSGFKSDALGEDYHYDSEMPQDQTNILGARIAGVDMPFTCTDSNGVKAERLHTAQQIVAVFNAGMMHILTNKAKYYSLVESVNTATTVDSIDNIQW